MSFASGNTKRSADRVSSSRIASRGSATGSWLTLGPTRSGAVAVVVLSPEKLIAG